MHLIDGLGTRGRDRSGERQDPEDQERGAQQYP
jgi:hypothetical protein